MEGQPGVVAAPLPTESITDSVEGNGVWMVYDVENATSMYVGQV